MRAAKTKKKTRTIKFYDVNRKRQSVEKPDERIEDADAPNDAGVDDDANRWSGSSTGMILLRLLQLLGKRRMAEQPREKWAIESDAANFLKALNERKLHRRDISRGKRKRRKRKRRMKKRMSMEE